MYNGLTLLRRVICCKLPCLFKCRQMWLNSQIQNLLTRLDSLNRSRKIILGLLILLGLIYYIVPAIFNLRRPSIVTDDLEECLNDRLDVFSKTVKGYDAFIKKEVLEEDEAAYPPYVGNGKVAASFNSENGLFIRLNRALSLPVKFYPVISTKPINTKVKEVTVLNIRSGLAHRIQTVESGGWSSKCSYVENRMYAHRSRPSVLVQDIKITNPSFRLSQCVKTFSPEQTFKVKKRPMFVTVDQVGASGWSGSKSYSKSSTFSYTVTSGEVDLPDPKYHVYVAISTVKVQKTTLSIKPKETKRLHVITVINYTKPYERRDDKTEASLTSGVEKELLTIMRMDSAALQIEHSKVWDKLWQSGFGISQSKAEGALNGDKINSTMYYVLSNVPAPLYDVASTQAQKMEIQKVLHNPDRCYSGHTTLHASTLWAEVEDEDDIARVTTTWMITLEKQGCQVMVRSGAEGVLQAMILSLGALKFGNDHLEFTMEPKDLHRDLAFHRINYGNNTHVNISVIVGDDNKASIYVALDRNDRPYYACDAGCIDPPMQLSKKLQRFPVKLTQPLTSILYITADKVHMEELKHVLHLQSIVEAPAHEHHVIALHKHGHHLGGLPTIFWASIAFLVIIFHLFLCKLIMNEYCQGQERFVRRKGYNV